MNQCFVIQPFDKGGKYDKRYSDVIEPAIKECGFEPYRVDQDPESQIPINDIDYHIRTSALCLAEITEDNPNVWFEIGLAIAYKKELVLICCSQERTKKYPFDIQHRTIISYENESLGDFDKLKDTIKTKIKALKDKIVNDPVNSEVSSALTDGLEEHEFEILQSIISNIENPDDGTSAFNVMSELEKKGYTRALTLLGLKRLILLDYIGFLYKSDYNNNEYTEYKITEKGMNWLMDNRHLFKENKINNKLTTTDIDF
jgi:hypothetical protein